MGRSRDALTGSIPACAGEARIALITGNSHEVYPRVRGGSIGPLCALWLAEGLSPRARGKRNVTNNIP